MSIVQNFLSIVDKCFSKNHPTNKIFNRQTLKLSYPCMPNMKTIIASHKKQILSNVATTPNQNHDPSCNCRKKAECPLDGKCLQANDSNNNRTVHGTGTTHSSETPTDAMQRNYLNNIWTLTDANKTFLIKWKVLKKFKPDNNTNKKCNLCLHQKFISVEKILVA